MTIILLITIVGKIFIDLDYTEREKNYYKLNATGDSNPINNQDNESNRQQQKCRATKCAGHLIFSGH